MSQFNKKLTELFEGSLMTPGDPGSGSGGGKIGFKVNDDKKGSTFRKKDARRKKRERARKKSINKKEDTIEEREDPRQNLKSELRLTLKEAFLSKLAEYALTKKSKPMKEIFELMEDYPQLKKYVKKKTIDSLPNKSFSVYAVRESTLTEEIGMPGYRSGNKPHNWCLNKQQSLKNNPIESYYIIEAKITPQQTIMYLPAFTKEIENLIYNGKIEEPEINVIRLIKKQNEIILPENIDSGIIVEVS